MGPYSVAHPQYLLSPEYPPHTYPTLSEGVGEIASQSFTLHQSVSFWKPFCRRHFSYKMTTIDDVNNEIFSLLIVSIVMCMETSSYNSWSAHILPCYYAFILNRHTGRVFTCTLSELFTELHFIKILDSSTQKCKFRKRHLTIEMRASDWNMKPLGN